MNRLSSPGGLAQYLGDSDLAEIDPEMKQNASFQSALSLSSSANASASSSKAVLAALRALQDKIRRLEMERTQALDQTGQLRHQLKNQEIEMEHAKQKDSLSAQRSIQDARNAYERLLTEKTDLEIKVARLEDRNRDVRMQSDDMQEKIRGLEQERHELQGRVRDLDSKQLQFDLQMQASQRKEKELAQSMVWETRRHEDEIATLNDRLRSLQEDLTFASRDKSDGDARLVELDELVGQLLQLNELLVAKLSGKSPKLVASSSSLKKKKMSGGGSGSIVPRAAYAGTAASEHGKYDWARTRQMITVNMEDVAHLRGMHEMYRNMAKSMKGDMRSRKSASSGGGGGGGTATVGKSATRMGRRKSRERSGSFSEGFGSVRSAQSGGGTSGASSSGSGGGSNSIRIPAPSVSFDNSLRLDDSEAEYDSGNYRGDSRASSASPSRRRSSSANGRMNVTNGSLAASGGILASALLASSGSPVPGSKRDSELQNVISSLEEEFDSLNVQYRRLLSSVQADDPVEDTQHAEELVGVIQKLQKKGAQLRALKSPG